MMKPVLLVVFSMFLVSFGNAALIAFYERETESTVAKVAELSVAGEKWVPLAFDFSMKREMIPQAEKPLGGLGWTIGLSIVQGALKE
ncbi:hypothetical protein [Roseibacillus persicicus]|nr:hypothetical protein [Roseibacillus persicicus]